jgi:hypothetical protein
MANIQVGRNFSWSLIHRHCAHILWNDLPARVWFVDWMFSPMPVHPHLLHRAEIRTSASEQTNASTTCAPAQPNTPFVIAHLWHCIPFAAGDILFCCSAPVQVSHLFLFSCLSKLDEPFTKSILSLYIPCHLSFAALDIFLCWEYPNVVSHCLVYRRIKFLTRIEKNVSTVMYPEHFSLR